MPSLTNIKTQPAYNGQGVRISIDASDSAEYTVFETLYVGMPVESPVSKKGTVASIDTYGATFLVVPDMPTESFNGSTPYKLVDGESIAIP